MENSNEDEYLEDGPGSDYIAAPYDITTALLKVQERKWGDVSEAWLQEKNDEMKDMISENSDETSWVEGSPNDVGVEFDPIVALQMRYQHHI